MKKIEKELIYKNIINNVEVIDILESVSYDKLIVVYYNTRLLKEFIKPLYVFEKSYVEI